MAKECAFQSDGFEKVYCELLRNRVECNKEKCPFWSDAMGYKNPYGFDSIALRADLDEEE